jgi:hypothetical protein
MKSTLVAILAAVVLMVGSAFAQDKVELSGSYQFTTAFVNGQNVNSNPGWNASATYYLGHSGLGIVTEWSGTDFDGAYNPTKKGSIAANTGAGGLQFQFNRKGVLRPYVNVLFGDTKYTTAGPANAFSQTLGGGVDLSLAKHFAVRGGVSYTHADFASGSGIQASAANSIRPIGGIVFRF